MPKIVCCKNLKLVWESLNELRAKVAEMEVHYNGRLHTITKALLEKNLPWEPEHGRRTQTDAHGD